MSTELDLRKKREEEEEKKKKGELAPGQATTTMQEATKQAVNTEEYKALPSATKKQIEQEAGNPTKVVEGATNSLSTRVENQEQNKNKPEGTPEEKSKEPSVKDSFFEALTFFLPTIGGAAIGGAFEGSAGAFKGGQMGMEVGKQYRDWKLEKEKLARRPSEELALQRLELAKGNLEARKEEIGIRREGAQNLEQDRGLRREERVVDRSIKIKEQFSKRKDIQGLKETIKALDDIDLLVSEGKKIPGATLAKIARSISGEVGVLTEQDVQRSQINPDFFNRLKRGYYINFKGEMSPDDAKELMKLTKIYREKKNESVRGLIKDFSESRAKSLKNQQIAKDLENDLKLEFGLKDKEEEEIKRGNYNFSREEIEAAKAKLRRK